jgi:glycosyltransferase involved in cell wall biosynthesis
LSKISIITINYNNAEGLKNTIQSVSNQFIDYFEYIVVDGGSSDGSVEIIKQSSKITKWVSEKDKGIYDAMNKGIAKASGEYCLFLNSGDVLVDDEVLSKVSTYLNSQKSFYYGNLILEKNNSKEEHIAPPNINLDFILNNTFWHPCVFIRTDLFKSFGHYDSSFKICGDYEFFVRCLIKPGISFEHINHFITLFDGNGISHDPSKKELQKQEREKAWFLNISDLIFGALKKQNQFSRSKYAAVINFFQKIRGKSTF